MKASIAATSAIAGGIGCVPQATYGKIHTSGLQILVGMSLLIAQSFEEHLNRGRLFEHVGYFLGALAFVILAGAVAWSIGKRFEGRTRKIVRATSLGGLCLLQFLFGAGLLIHYVWGSGSQSHQTTPRVAPVTTPEPPRTAKLVLHVSADGTINTDDRSISADEIDAYLTERIREWEAQGIRHENLTVELRTDPQVPYVKVFKIMNTCQELGVVKFAVKNKPGDDHEQDL